MVKFWQSQAIAHKTLYSQHQYTMSIFWQKFTLMLFLYTNRRKGVAHILINEMNQEQLATITSLAIALEKMNSVSVAAFYPKKHIYFISIVRREVSRYYPVIYLKISCTISNHNECLVTTVLNTQKEGK